MRSRIFFLTLVLFTVLSLCGCDDEVKPSTGDGGSCPPECTCIDHGDGTYEYTCSGSEM